jgi:hypothetical protein
MNDPRQAFDRLLELQEQFERGPKREGAFAVWLLARVAHDIGAGPAEVDRGTRRRLALLDRRLAPLAVSRPLARGITAALAHLQEATPAAARIALSQLVAPAREALGGDAGEAIAVLARDVHQTLNKEQRGER